VKVIREKHGNTAFTCPAKTAIHSSSYLQQVLMVSFAMQSRKMECYKEFKTDKQTIL
jgi:hypothetical protein